jgi:hypothetical protein
LVHYKNVVVVRFNRLNWEGWLILLLSHSLISRTIKQRQNCFVFLPILWAILTVCPAYGAAYFVSPAGSDSSTTGSIDAPFKTIGKAVGLAVAGDTIYLRGGQHNYTSTVSISKSGQLNNPITLRCYQDESPILDFAGQATGSSSRGISLSGSYWFFYGFTVQNAGDNGIYVTGTYNRFERLVTCYNEDAGFQLHSGAANNLVVNCDSCYNYDPANHGENADGFATKFTLGTGNILRGCRSWGNSDDGYDCWNYEDSQSVTFDNCWAFRNGIDIWGEGTAFAGDGNGFKLGAGSGAHFLFECLAYNNPHNGIDVNGNITGVTVYNCTAAQNGGPNFYFDEHSSSHVLRNNLSYLGSVNIYAEIDDAYNSWNGFTVSSADFRSLDSTGIDGPRQADGGLPKLTLLRLWAASSLVNAGINLGYSYEGSAPDLGAFEYIYGDCEGDGDIDTADLACLASNWLDVSCGTCNGADFDSTGSVNLNDFAYLSDNWLE